MLEIDDGQDEQSGYKDAERKDLERLIQGQSHVTHERDMTGRC